MLIIRRTSCLALRILCISLPILIALVAMTLIVTYDTDRNTVQTAGVAGATQPSVN